MKFVRIFTLFIIVTILVQFSVDARKKPDRVVTPSKKVNLDHTSKTPHNRPAAVPAKIKRDGDESTPMATHKNEAAEANAKIAKGEENNLVNATSSAKDVHKKLREKETGRGGGGRGGGFGGGMRSSGGFGGGMRGGYSGGMRGGYSGRGYSGYNSNYSMMGRGRRGYGYGGRGYGYGYRGYGMGFNSRWWWPWYRNSWIYGVRHYPQIYVRRNSRSCGSICRNLVFNCIKFDIDHDEDGNLNCKCIDDNNDEETVFEKWCWTPSKCVKARGGSCKSIMRKIKSRFEEEEQKRR